MGNRNFRNGPATTLNGAVGPADTTMVVVDASGFPVLAPYTLIIDKDEATEEVVDVTNAVSNTLTVTRGVDGTTAFAHASGAVAVHGTSARDPQEANTHVNSSSDVHGVTGALVGTTMVQTLTGKTLTSPIINSATIVTPAISGGGITGTRITEPTFIQPNGAGTKVSLNDSTGVERGYIDGNGEVQAARLRAINTNAALIPIYGKAASSQSGNVLLIEDSSGGDLLAVGPTGRVGVNHTAPTSVGLHVSGATTADHSFRVTRLASQTGALIQAVDEASAVLFSVDKDGNVTIAGTVTSADTTDWATYSSAMTNRGTASFSFQSGRWKRIAKKTVAFTVQWSVGVAGSGSGSLGFDLPTACKRDVRIAFGGHSETPGAVLSAVAFTGGSGTLVDRILEDRGSTLGNLTGADLTVGRIITISGVYEEA